MSQYFIHGCQQFETKVYFNFSSGFEYLSILFFSPYELEVAIAPSALPWNHQ